ncbi:MAG: ComEC/Rec2 family competence protein [Alphaproteobacteria bacterium]
MKALTKVRGLLPRAASWTARFRKWLLAELHAQRLRWALWLPVAFAAGVGGYFSLHDEPPLWWAATACVLASAAVWRLRMHAAVIPASAVLAAALGFLAADLRTERVAAPVLAKRMGVVEVTGRILRRSPDDSGTRILIDVDRIDRLPQARTPARVRLSWRGDWPPDVGAGDWIRVRAVLRPLPGQVAPGAFDFARYAWFRRIGALGFTIEPPQPVRPPSATGIMEQAAARLGRLRRQLAARFRAAMPPVPAAVAEALVTGERGGIPDAGLEAMRDSGLAHLLAISGLHMMLVGGFAFMALRGLLTLSEKIALTRPVTKWAALAALPVAAAYLAVSGAPISAQRAFLMFSLMMIALVLERRPLSMRVVALTALFVLALTPESLLEAGFQMSFAAVVALIAAYEAQGGRFAPRSPPAGRLDRTIDGVWRLVAGIAMTTVIASTATAPFAAYHFQHTAFYALPANLAAMPVFMLMVMPFGLLGILLMPLGLEEWPLTVMGWGIEAILGIAATVSGWPGATADFPAPPLSALVLTALGGLWFCIWAGKLRWLGAAPLAAAVAALLMADRPGILIDDKGGLIAVREGTGGSYYLSESTPRFVARSWLERDGDGRTVRDAASDAPPGWRCDARGCILMRDGRPWLAHVRRARALDEDCGRVKVLISEEPVRGPCEGPELVVGRFDLWRKGAHAVWLTADGMEVRRLETTGSLRPWSPYRTRLRRGGRAAQKRGRTKRGDRAQ